MLRQAGDIHPTIRFSLHGGKGCIMSPSGTPSLRVCPPPPMADIEAGSQGGAGGDEPPPPQVVEASGATLATDKGHDMHQGTGSQVGLLPEAMGLPACLPAPLGTHL